MELFTKLFGDLLVFVYHCFDRIVIHGYLSGLSRPGQVVYFFRQVVGVAEITKEVLSRRTNDYQHWVEAFACNVFCPHHLRRWSETVFRKKIAHLSDAVLKRLVTQDAGWSRQNPSDR